CRILGRGEIFFTPQPHLAQHLSYSAFADTDAAGLQALAQLHLGQVRLLLQPAPQTVFRRLRDPADGTMLRLRRPLLLPGVLLLPSDLLAVRQAYSELASQFPQAAGTRLIGFQKLATQIIRIGLRHPFVAAKIASPNLSRFTALAYSNSGSALAAAIADVVARRPAFGVRFDAG